MIRLLLLALAFTLPVYADSYVSRPDLHAPITVMGDHTHNRGSSMISYRFMTMPMDALRQGTESVSRLDAFSNGYMNAPKSMTMDMHMIGGMYGLSDKVTLMAMISHRKNTMTSIKMMDRSESTVEASGIGDVTVSAMVKVIERDDLKSHFNFGLSLPTGAIDKEDNNMTLGYGMQLGSGTLDLRPEWSFVRYFDSISLGAKSNAVFRSSQNKKGYALGNTLKQDLWLAKVWSPVISTSLRVTAQYDTGVSGQHDDIANQQMNTAMDPQNTGGKVAVVGVGSNIHVPFDQFDDLALGLEYTIPVYQNLNGIQLELENVLSFGLTKGF